MSPPFQSSGDTLRGIACHWSHPSKQVVFSNIKIPNFPLEHRKLLCQQQLNPAVVLGFYYGPEEKVLGG